MALFEESATQSDIKRQFTALNISSSYDDHDQYKIFDEFKSRKTSWWRWWKQRSRFQRTMIYMGTLLIIVCLILFAPSLTRTRSPVLRNEQQNPPSSNNAAHPNKEKSPNEVGIDDDKKIPKPVIGEDQENEVENKILFSLN